MDYFIHIHLVDYFNELVYRTSAEIPGGLLFGRSVDEAMADCPIGYGNAGSAISLIGAPAFIALKSNGGLVWLQYEFAIPLAMMLIMLILVPLYHKTRAITIYEYLENRFGKSTRTSISAVFLISRALGSGVALLATGIVTAVCLDWPLWETILELVNKIGSAFYGPILATFWLGMLTKRGNQKGAIIGLVIGVGFNIFLWKYYGSAVSWLWWNVFGFVLAFGFGYIFSRLFYKREDKIDSTYLINYGDIKSFIGEKKYYYILTMVFILIILSSFLIQLFFSV